MAAVDFSHLLPPSAVAQLVRSWLAEDIPSFDYGGAVVGDKHGTATLWGKAKGVLAAVPFFNQVFEELQCKVVWLVKEGEWFDPSTQANGRVHLATVTGPVRNILMGERTALNIIARACGIATQARIVKGLAEAVKWKGKVAATRKTTPGFRLVEKYAISVGGCDTHRMDLSSMVMLKDNHVWSQGSITKAVGRAKDVAGFSVKIEVECQSEQEAMDAIAAGADVVMLDNFKPAQLPEVCQRLKAHAPHVLLEVSGGITPATVSQYFAVCDHVDILSMGNLTQSVPHIDISLKINK
eukprot:TRINITY_DN4012_c0_g1_i1.p1 TRINITY_DN4012_c0_g1~~TRINITY_DN4012_c0_g1_i1.p1  ORF type:complete len:308 (+),score=106.14 TRINITY_DN4012_c0_g1_i1:38-925(+)